MTSRLVLAISIDVECDKDERWRVRRPLAFRSVLNGIGEVLHPLFAEYNAAPTYLLSPEVLQDGECASLLGGLASCELGAHLHSEFLWNPEGVNETSRVACGESVDVELRALERLTELYVDAFERQPGSYRAGRYGASARSIQLLRRLGYTVDTSVTPYKRWDYGLDFRGAPVQPYYPATDDIARPGPIAGVMEIPITILPAPAPPWAQRLTRELARTRVAPVRRLAKRASSPVWLRPGWSSPRTIERIVRQASRAPGHTVLNMMFHNVDVVPGCSPNSATAAAVARALDGVRTALETTLEVAGCFMTLRQVKDEADRRLKGAAGRG